MTNLLGLWRDEILGSKMCQTFSKQLETEGNGSEYRAFPLFSSVSTFISGCIN